MTSRLIQLNVIVAATLLLAGTLSISAAHAGEPPPVLPAPAPPAATRVHVAAGAETSGINVTLRPHAVGSISGRVVESGSKRPLKYLLVRAYSPSRRLVAQGETSRHGKYTVSNLPASKRGYRICFGGYHPHNQDGVESDVRGGTSTTGWAPECYRNQVWSGVTGSVPAHATRVRVHAGQVTQHVNAQLQPGGAISGKIVPPPGGHANGTVVYVRSVGAPHYRRSIYTGSGESHYRVRNLPPAPDGYQVCFTPLYYPRSTGLVPRCYGTTTWPHPPMPFGDPPLSDVRWPSAAKRISVPSGTERSGITVQARHAGAIGGRLVDRTSGALAAGFAQLRVYDRAGRLASSGITYDGQFKIWGLPPAARYYVCALPVRYYKRGIDSAHDSHQAGCYHDIRWRGPASRTAGSTVHVSRGKTHSGLVTRLRRASTISGRVTSAAGGQPVRGRVYLYTGAGRFLQSESTIPFGKAGKYAFVDVPASHSGYLVCASAFALDHGPGLRPECFGQARWDGAAAAPSTHATPIRVGRNTHHRHRDIALHVGGTISGHIAKVGHKRIPAEEYVIDDAGNLVTVTFGSTWSIAGLDPARTYRVCAEKSGGQPNYQPTCYRNVRWYRPWTD